jgi:hypothetical protein
MPVQASCRDEARRGGSTSSSILPSLESYTPVWCRGTLPRTSASNAATERMNQRWRRRDDGRDGAAVGPAAAEASRFTSFTTSRAKASTSAGERCLPSTARATTQPLPGESRTNSNVPTPRRWARGLAAASANRSAQSLTSSSAQESAIQKSRRARPARDSTVSLSSMDERAARAARSVIRERGSVTGWCPKARGEPDASSTSVTH